MAAENDMAHQNEEATEEESLNDNPKPNGLRPRYTIMCYGLSHVTVEPSMSLFVMSCIIMMLTTQNLSLEKACRVNLNYTDEICSNLKTQQVEGQSEYEKETQKLLAKFIASRTYISATVPCILALLAGSFSDRTGFRKVFILIPIAGQMLACISNMINVYFFYELRLEVLIFSEAFFEGFSGGWCLLFFVVFAYISTISSHETRTFRLGLINFALTVGFPIGMGISGVLLKNYGYYGCYGLAFCLHLFNLLYNAFKITDPPKSGDQIKNNSKRAVYLFRSFFDLSNMKDSIRVVFKNEPKNRRLRMCIMMIIVCLLFGPMYGEISILYMNTRYRFQWDEVKFSIYQTYNFISHTIGTLFCLVVLSKYLKWHDAVLGIISTLSKIAASFVYCFAPNERIFFIAPLVDILNGTSLISMRSMVSKMVPPNELGKVNSIFGLAENLMPLLFVPLYTSVYKATMDVMPGAVFLMGTLLTVPAVITFIWFFIEHRRGTEPKRTIDETKPPAYEYDAETELPVRESLLIPS